MLYSYVGPLPGCPLAIYRRFLGCQVAISSPTLSSWYAIRYRNHSRLLTSVRSYPPYAAPGSPDILINDTTTGTTPRWFDYHPWYAIRSAARYGL